jgi:hypothetical protein
MTGLLAAGGAGAGAGGGGGGGVFFLQPASKISMSAEHEISNALHFVIDLNNPPNNL